MSILSKIYEKIYLRILLRDQYESLDLRRWFKSKYNIDIGLYSYGCFDRWRIPPGTTVGRYCSIAQTARILDANHPMDALTTHPYFYEARFGVVDRDRVSASATTIEDGVWLSHNVTITPSCNRIGRGAIVGAGAIVSRDVPPYAIVAGAPARLIRHRFDEATIARIEASRWWELDKAGLARLVRENPDFAFSPATAGANQGVLT